MFDQYGMSDRFRTSDRLRLSSEFGYRSFINDLQGKAPYTCILLSCYDFHFERACLSAHPIIQSEYANTFTTVSSVYREFSLYGNLMVVCLDHLPLAILGNLK